MIKKRKQPFNNWLGTPLSKSSNSFNVWGNKPINMLNTNSKNIPVNMFKDNDKDGVSNAFDCKPNNKNKQGLIDAIVGGVKGVFGGGSGAIRKGWNEGMAKEGNFASRAIKSYKEKRNRYVEIPSQKNYKETEIKPEVIQKIRTQEGQRGLEKAKQENRLNIVRRVGKYVYKAVPGLSETLSPTKTQKYSEEVPTKWEVNKEGKKVEVAWKRVEKTRQVPQSLMEHYGAKLQKSREETMEGKMPKSEQHKIGALKSGLRMFMPAIPAVATKATYGGQSKKGYSSPGRPRGTVKYSIQGRPVGVFEYRKYMSAQRQRFKQEQRAQLLAQQAARIKASMPQYEQVQQQQYPQQQQMQQMQQQQQQLPPELQGQGITPEYSQYQQAQLPEEMATASQPVMQEYPGQEMPQQYPRPQQQAPQREIATVFKGSGGKPYPAVDRTPLTRPQQTIPYGYVESVDAFTGRRFMKQLPKQEGWTR